MAPLIQHKRKVGFCNQADTRFVYLLRKFFQALKRKEKNIKENSMVELEQLKQNTNEPSKYE